MDTGRRDVAARMAGAAGDLLASLSDDERALAQWPFPSDDERRLWFYTPTDHGGVVVGNLRPSQQRLVMQLVSSGLSLAAYVTASTIMSLENVLDAVEGWTSQYEGDRGRNPSRYYVRVFGSPGEDAWSWRFGGHHVSINHLVIDGEVCASTPCFFGANPASSPLLGPHPLRPLAGAEDLGRELVRSLDPAQSGVALISPVAPTDVVGANRPRLSDGDLPLPLSDIWRDRFRGGRLERLAATQQRAEDTLGLRAEHLEALRLTVEPKGVKATSLTRQQRELLQRLLDVYLHRLPDELADEEAAKVAGPAFDALSFAWAGGTAPGEPHYYRVQGETVLIEYDNTQNGVNHVHSVWRDRDRDFGGDVLMEHYRAAH